MGEGDISQVDQMESGYKTASTLQQMGKAAAGAVAMSAVICGTLNVVRYIQMVQEGKLSEEEAVIEILVETTSSAADSAVKAGSVVGAQSLLVRYGSEKVLIDTLSKQSLKSLAKNERRCRGGVCAIDAVKDLVTLGLGKLSREEFFER